MLQAIALGILQGLTEFLPVSSSGHLVLAQALLHFDVPEPLAFDVVLHFGTLIAVLIYFRKDLLGMLAAVSGREVDDAEVLRRWVWLLALATVPVVIVAALFAETIAAAFTSVPLVGVSLIVTGAMLALVSGRGGSGAGPAQVGAREALIVGAFQVVGIVPGISRSGSTIVGGLIGGLERETAARFAFLMSVPAIAGAMVRNAAGVAALLVAEPLMLAAGATAAALTGWLAIDIMMKVVRSGRLLWFALYCLALGSLTLVVSAVVG